MAGTFALGLWWGKLVGALLGAMLGGWPGLGLGALLGAQFDSRLRLERCSARAWRGLGLSDEDARFLSAACAAIGGLLPSQGPAQEQVRVIRELLWELSLNSAQRRRAWQLIGESAAEPLPQRLLAGRLRGGGEQGEWLLRALSRLAVAEGASASARQRELQRLAQRLGVDFSRLGGHFADEAESETLGFIRRRVDDACDLLGVDPLASVAEIKQAYRRAVARHHPDRLLAQGAAEAQVRAATELTREIRLAYEDIRSSRGF